MKLYNYLITIDDEHGMFFIGGKRKPASPGKVWMCNPTGVEVMEVEASKVRCISKKELARLLQEEIQWQRKNREQQARSE